MAKLLVVLALLAPCVSAFAPSKRWATQTVRFSEDEDSEDGRKALRRKRDDNDFLAVEKERALQAKNMAPARAVTDYDIAQSKFGGWVGGFLVGTPMSDERPTDEEDFASRLSKRVEERRLELGMDQHDSTRNLYNPDGLREG
ncbi:hypothetical protein M885DRAFT_562090 [Pelagophyceae sp. CCMP2097]|nr:hypothetical protein M885DRAFT_562090 [Pelagophyceae sp. CCMP2097]